MTYSIIGSGNSHCDKVGHNEITAYNEMETSHQSTKYIIIINLCEYPVIKGEIYRSQVLRYNKSLLLYQVIYGAIKKD